MFVRLCRCCRQFVSPVIPQSPLRRKLTPVSSVPSKTLQFLSKHQFVCSPTRSHDQFVRVDEPFGATAAACMQKHWLLPDNGVCAIIARSSSSCVDGEGHPSVQRTGPNPFIHPLGPSSARFPFLTSYGSNSGSCSWKEPLCQNNYLLIPETCV